MKPHTCEVCGKPIYQKRYADNKVVCSKHYRQFLKHKRFLDNNPRTIKDLNEIRIENGIACMDLYDRQCEVVATVIFDVEDIPKVKYTKWFLSSTGYALNKQKFSGGIKYFHREILGTDNIVDHINGNRLDNRKSNLRECTKSQNAMNQKHVKGVYVKQNGKYQAQIKINQKAINLGMYIYRDEALWARWYAERILFKEFAKESEEPEILESRKKDIKDYILSKVQRL